LFSLGSQTSPIFHICQRPFCVCESKKGKNKNKFGRDEELGQGAVRVDVLLDAQKNGGGPVVELLERVVLNDKVGERLDVVLFHRANDVFEERGLARGLERGVHAEEALVSVAGSNDVLYEMWSENTSLQRL